MKPLLIAGIVVVALGAILLTRGLSYPSRHSVLKIGDLEASVQHERAIPPWVGIVAVAGGAVLIGFGLRGRKS